jgi:hypothetical protein
VILPPLVFPGLTFRSIKKLWPLSYNKLVIFKLRQFDLGKFVPQFDDNLDVELVSMSMRNLKRSIDLTFKKFKFGSVELFDLILYKNIKLHLTFSLGNCKVFNFHSLNSFC